VPQPEHLIEAAFRSHLSAVITLSLVMAYMGVWRLQELFEENKLD
jgi:hypothetical protein